LFSAQAPEQSRRRPPAIGAIVGKRQEQQDAARVETYESGDGETGDLLIVADGMGGHAGGREAGTVAVDAFARAFLASRGAPLRLRLRQALEEANQSVGGLAAARRELRGMGCTIVAAVLAGNDLRWISVGDSLLLAVRDRQIVRLNADHSLAPALDEAARSGLISPEAAQRDPDRHVLRSAVTGGALTLVDEGVRRIGEGALVLLATDGLLTLPLQRIAEIASGGQDAEQVVGDLLRAVERDMPEDQDNTTIVAAHCSGGTLAGGLSRPRRRRRRGLALLVLGVAVAIGAFAAAILIDLGRGDGGGGARPAPAQKASGESRPSPRPTPAPPVTGDFDGRVFKSVPKPQRQRTPRPAPPRPPPSPKAEASQPAPRGGSSPAPSPTPRQPAASPAPPAPAEKAATPPRSGATPVGPRLSSAPGGGRSGG
jgi:protein phosphatase